MKLFRGIKSCLGSIVSMLIVLAAAYGGWRWGDIVFPRLETVAEGVGIDLGGDGADDEMAATEDLSERASERLSDFRQSSGSREVAFSASELTSMLRFTHAVQVPTVISEPRVRIEDGRISLLGRVAVRDVPAFPDLGDILSILPDTLDLEARGTVIPMNGPGAALLVDRMEAAGIPLPRRVVPAILDALDREPLDGLPENAIQIPLPSGVESAFLDGDALLLRSGG